VEGYCAHGLDDGGAVILVQAGQTHLAAEVLKVVLVEDRHLALLGNTYQHWP
jgi:hypothetical protein